MSEINEDNTEVTEAGNDAVPPENGSLEARARRMGWIDKEKFNGPEEMFVSAEEFIEKGENELPILRDRLRKQDSTIVDLDNNMKTLQNDLKYLKGATARAEKRGYEEGLAAARAKQREAVEEGDTYKFDTAQAEIDALTPPAEVAAEVPDRPMPREITEFTSRNKTWYGSDLEMTSFADEKFDGIVKQYPGYTLEQQLAATEAKVRKEYPDKFGNPRRGNPGEVEGGNTPPPQKKSGKSYNDLPKEAQEMCDRFIAQGVIKNREEYIKEYDFDG